jgi:UDP-N-acetylmuramoylalanine--D-glutamate ligase
MRALVYGLAVTGESTVRALQRRGVEVVVADDAVSDQRRARAADLGVELLDDPGVSELAALLSGVDLVSPSPGVPETHRVIVTARDRGVPVRSEIDLAYEWEQDRPGGPRPMLAVTGTDGKTTTTLLAEAMLRAGGRRAVAAGNTELPLVDALEHDADAFVVECSSFRLAFTDVFRAEASVWLNLAPDHQNWHADMSSYEAAKARMWRHVRPHDVAIGWADDPVVMRNLAAVSCRTRTFATRDGDYRVDAGSLVGPKGPICAVGAMRRSLPHDVTNALAAAALVMEPGFVEPAAIATALGEFRGPPHRIELVAEADGVRWYDDSKATSPHAALTAIRSFDRLVLIAGGRNKGLDLGMLAVESARLVGVVAIGEAAGELVAAFEGRAPVEVAGSMEGAVVAARRLARPGDAVVLSPACASFDWYDGYASRGEDFVRRVRAVLGEPPGGHPNAQEVR